MDNEFINELTGPEYTSQTTLNQIVLVKNYSHICGDKIGFLQYCRREVCTHYLFIHFDSYRPTRE